MIVKYYAVKASELVGQRRKRMEHHLQAVFATPPRPAAAHLADRMCLLSLLFALLALFGPFQQVSAATVQVSDLGVLPGGTYSQASGVSADGLVVVGSGTASSGHERAFRWTQAGGMQDLGVLPGGNSSNATGVNADGSVIVGSGNGHAFRWTQAGMQDLGVLPGGIISNATGVSADGSVVAGYSHTPSGLRAFRWTHAGGMQDLGVLPGGSYSQAYGVSADGSTVVGYSTTPSGVHVFRWTHISGMQDLGVLTNGGSRAQAVSADGSAVVGYETVVLAGYENSVNHAFRWTQASGMQNLGTLPGGFSSGALGVSADGSVVVGFGNTSSSIERAFRWTQAGGMQELGELSGGDRSRAAGVSADGSVVVGYSIAASGWHAARWKLTAAATVVTPTGSNVAVSTSAMLPDGSSTVVSLTFDSVLGAGQTSVTTSSTGAPPPSGFKLGQPPVYYDVTTTATFAGSALVCLNWVQGQFHNESALRLWHMENNLWQDVTSSVNTTTNTICGQVTSLSPFILAEKSYAFTGFLQPVDNPPAVNGAKAGSAIPVKFSLGAYQGMNIFDAGSPRLQAVACQAGALVQTVEQTVTSSTSGLTYDTTSGQYVFVWKTDKSLAGSCQTLLLDFNDGTQRKASFIFTR